MLTLHKVFLQGSQLSTEHILFKIGKHDQSNILILIVSVHSFRGNIFPFYLKLWFVNIFYCDI